MTIGIEGRVDHAAVLTRAADLIRVEGHQDHPREERDTAEHLATVLEHALAGRGELHLQEVEGGRLNVVAHLRGDRPGPRLLLNAHLDTVPGYGMPRAYDPAIRDGRLYGRGAVDMKGALAAMVHTIELFAAADVSFSGELILAAVAGEENGSPGMLAFTRSDITADLAVVGEPTGLRVATAHKGVMWIEARFTGRATHGSAPEAGINAIYHAARFVTAVETELVPRLAGRTHPLLGAATASVGVVRGGDRPPMVPATCSVQLDRRWLPGEDHLGVVQEIAELVASLRVEDPSIDAVVEEMAGTGGFSHAPLDCDLQTPGVKDLCAIVADRVGCPPDPIGVTFWTDGALLAEATGTPAVVCGPGGIEQAHSLDEWVSLEQLEAAAEVYVGFASRYLEATLVGKGEGAS